MWAWGCGVGVRIRNYGHIITQASVELNCGTTTYLAVKLEVAFLDGLFCKLFIWGPWCAWL